METGSAPPFPTLLAPHLPMALEEINVPSYVIDSTGRIVWLNAAARAVVGDVTGRLFTSVVDPHDVQQARAQFARDLQTDEPGEFALDVVGRDGRKIQAEISSVPLRSSRHALGVFGIARIRSEGPERPARLDGRLTPRQHEILVLLADGASTDQIAEMLHLSRETVRNHVRHILRRLGVSSRLEAVALARREHIL
jgi:PAS domain S-box-containing protein